MVSESTTLPREITANGIACSMSGAGPAVVLLHGVGLRSECWLQQVQALQQAYSVIAMDLPGHGQSAALGNDRPTLVDYADRLHTAIEEIAGQSIAVIGHSLGALIALELAIRYPAMCRGAAALSAVYRRTKEQAVAVRQRAAALRDDESARVSAAPVERWFGASPEGQEAAMADLCREWLEETSRAGYAEAYGVFANEDGPRDEALRALRIPVLFLTGGNDTNSTPEMSSAMADSVPRGKSAVVSGAGHMVMMTHEHAVNDALLGFLAACDDNDSIGVSGNAAS